MTNQEQVALLKRSRERWNKWREEHAEESRYPDLSDADLSGVDLGHANLSYADLSYANLSDVDLSYADLSYADLSYANLSRVNFNGTNLSYADLSHADLSHADLSHALLNDQIGHFDNGSGADLSHANLNDVKLSGADLVGVNFSHANLSDVKLRGADFGGANLSYANFSGAYLSGAYLGDHTLDTTNLSGANFSGADLSEAYLGNKDLRLCDLSGANLLGTNLRRANLSGQDLKLRDLSRANLSEANLSDVDLSGANLSEADLSGADLSDVDLSETNLTGTVRTNWTHHREMRKIGYGQMGNEATQQAVATRVATAQDASGKITVGLFQKAAIHPQQHFTNFAIEVDADMIVIGGGGRGDETIGALLTASFPRDDWTAWFVSSKDHNDRNPHYLVGFALGMKIGGMSRNELLDMIRVFQREVSPSAHPEATASIPDDYILLGGGFNVLWEGEGNLATASFPTTEGAWTARSKDHEQADPSSLRAYAIGVRQQLPVGVVNWIVQTASSSLVAHPRSTAILPNGFVITGGGAEIHWRGAGNLLWNLEPHVGGFTAAAKDHRISDPGSITTYALGIQLQ